MSKRNFEINLIGRHYYNLFKATETYLTREDRRWLSTLYKMAGQHGKNRSKVIESLDWSAPLLKGLKNVQDPKSIFRDYLNRVREIRKEMKPQPYESAFKLATRGGVVCIKGRYFSPMSDARWLANRIAEWRPNLIGHLSTELSAHSLKREISLANTKLTISPGEALLRRKGVEFPREDDRHIPLVATDRFIMWFPNGVPEKICDGDDVQVAFITDDSKPRVAWGWLSKHGTEFGCSAHQSDARKAAKMRAVRKAKKALGLI